MHIALITHIVRKGNGQGRVNFEIVHEAVRRGHQVTLVAQSVAPTLEHLESVNWVRVPVGGYPTQLIRDQVFGWQSTRWLQAHHQTLDVVIANGAVTWAPTDVNIVHFVHSTWPTSSVHAAKRRSGPYAWYQHLYTNVSAYWERRAFRKADQLVAVSPLVQRELSSLGISESKVDVIPNGVDLHEFTPGAARREALNLPTDSPLGVFVGDLTTYRKNLDTVLSALRHLPHFHLAVVGDLEDSSYPRLSRELGVHSRTHFMGYRKDVPEVMRAANVCLCPSRYDPFSLVALEALATGVPVVTSQNVGAAQLIPDACGCVVQDPEDDEAIAEAMSELCLKHKDDACDRARETARQYSFSAMANQYANLIGL